MKFHMMMQPIAQKMATEFVSLVSSTANIENTCC